MKKLAFMNTISRSAHRMAFKLQKHSPEILVVAGVIGAVASAVMACKATTKLGDILDESRDKIDSIHDVRLWDGSMIKRIRSAITMSISAFTILTKKQIVTL